MKSRFQMNIATLVWILGLPLGRLIASSADSLVDVFPLKPSMCYSYDFADSSDWTDFYQWNTATNKGRIHYCVLDSSIVGDRTIVWNLLEIRDYTARRMHSQLVGRSYDSTFEVADTVSLQLKEDLDGRHELKCSGIIWSFPLGHMMNSIHVPLVRYADSSQVQLTWSWNDPPGSMYYGGGTDTLTMSRTVGYTWRSLHEHWMTGYLVGANVFEARVVTEPLVVRSTRGPSPGSSYLYQNFPNPFNPRTTITYHLDRSGSVSLQIVNLQGQVIETLHWGNLRSGEYSVSWDGRNHPSGLYLCRLRTDEQSYIVKLLLVR